VFGQLVKGWGLLRRALPASIDLRETLASVIALFRLHNFCVDCMRGKSPCPLALDQLEISANGGIPLVAVRERESG
jgi:hypothetical protein